MSNLALPPLGLYIHIPWCLKKCPYCDFNSHAVTKSLPEKTYIETLLNDLKQDLSFAQGRKLESIFIGGGTPSLFSPASIEKLLAGTEQLIGFTADIEITMEANPGTFEIEKFTGFRNAGVNRLSIGIQSFDNTFLQALGRVHDGNEARHATANARSAGFDNFNLDLMFGLPGQTTTQALVDLKTAAGYEPSHLSWYQLTIEPNTVYYSNPPILPSDDMISDIQDAGNEFLASAGMERYEVSAFSKPDMPSKHNLNYWKFGDYLGIGAGAHGKITLINEQRIIRTRKARQPDNYLQREDQFTVETTSIASEELPLEFMMNALRLKDGCTNDLYEQRTGLPLTTVISKLELLQEKGLLRKDKLGTTEKGFTFLNSLLEEFLPSVHHNKVTIPLHSLDYKKE